jgi:hypothetical protein
VGSPAPSQASPWLAVQPSGDRLAQARALQHAHEAFNSGTDVTDRLRAVASQPLAGRRVAFGRGPVLHRVEDLANRCHGQTMG